MYAGASCETLPPIGPTGRAADRRRRRSPARCADCAAGRRCPAERDRDRRRPPPAIRRNSFRRRARRGVPAIPRATSPTARSRPPGRLRSNRRRPAAQPRRHAHDRRQEVRRQRRRRSSCSTRSRNGRSRIRPSPSRDPPGLVDHPFHIHINPFQIVGGLRSEPARDDLERHATYEIRDRGRARSSAAMPAQSERSGDVEGLP